MTTITELKELKTHGFSEVYSSNAALQKLHVSQETEASKIARLEKQLQIETSQYQEQLRVRLTEFTNLEKKLEKNTAPTP